MAAPAQTPVEKLPSRAWSCGELTRAAAGLVDQQPPVKNEVAESGVWDIAGEFSVEQLQAMLEAIWGLLSCIPCC